MRRPLITLFIAGAMCAALGACGDDVAPRTPFADAGTDAEPSLTDGGLPSDVGAADDARPPFDGSSFAVQCDAGPCVVRLTAGAAHYCALLADGTVRCWGDPAFVGASEEALDAGADAEPFGSVPLPVAGLSDVRSVAATDDETCVVLGDGGVDCWGPASPLPARVPDAPPARSLTPGIEVSCAVGTDDGLHCWGDSVALGSGVRSVGLGGEKAATVAIGTQAAFVTTTKGELLSWGVDSLVLGRRLAYLWVDLIPTKVQGIPAVLDVSTSSRHACAVTTDGRLFCWGAGENGKLGVGYVRDEMEPVGVSFASAAYPQRVAAGESHTCARMTDGTVFCWGGLNERGELGTSKFGGVYVPRLVGELPADVVSVAVGWRSTCALAIDGHVRCWGDNSSGQLGLGRRDIDRHPSPTLVLFP